VHQSVICRDCGDLFSHDTHHSQFFYHTSATALRHEAAVDHANQMVGAGGASLGQLLSRIEGQTLKTCDMDSGILPPPPTPALLPHSPRANSHSGRI